MLRRPTSACCAAILALAFLGAHPVFAAPPPGSDAPGQPPNPAPAAAAPAPDPGSEEEARIRVDRAIEAWRQGEWTEVRDLLEPLARDPGGIADPLLEESALRYLTEATLLDEGLDPSERKELARGYIRQLLEDVPDWTPPSGLHGRGLYELVAEVRSEAETAAAEECKGKFLACDADLTELGADHEKLLADYAAQDVAVQDIIKRNRGLALIPLGVGHFTNDNYALGGSFLALEVASGIAGLSLLLYRVRGLGCVRTNGFAPKSVVCPAGAEDDIAKLQDHVEIVRNAETVMGYVFLGSIVLDIVVAQALFKPITVVDRGQMSREQLEREKAEARDPSSPRRKRKQPSAKLEIIPHPTYIPRGLGFGVSLRF